MYASGTLLGHTYNGSIQPNFLHGSSTCSLPEHIYTPNTEGLPRNYTTNFLSHNTYFFFLISVVSNIPFVFLVNPAFSRSQFHRQYLLLYILLEQKQLIQNQPVCIRVIFLTMSLLTAKIYFTYLVSSNILILHTILLPHIQQSHY